MKKIKRFFAWLALIVSAFFIFESVIGLFDFATSNSEIEIETNKLLFFIALIIALTVIAIFLGIWGLKNSGIMTPTQLSPDEIQNKLKKYEFIINQISGISVVIILLAAYQTWNHFVSSNTSLASHFFVLWVFFILVVLVKGLINKNLIAAIIFTAHQIAGFIYFIPSGEPSTMYIFISIFVSTHLVMGTVAIFMHNKLNSELKMTAVNKHNKSLNQIGANNAPPG